MARHDPPSSDPDFARLSRYRVAIMNHSCLLRLHVDALRLSFNIADGRKCRGNALAFPQEKRNVAARVIADRRGRTLAHFFPRSRRRGAWPPGDKNETFTRGWRRIDGSPSFFAHLSTCLPACLPFSPARDPTDLRKHTLIYGGGGSHPSVAVGTLAIYENLPPGD